MASASFESHPSHQRPISGRQRVRGLIREFEQDARLDQVFVVLTVGATLIATLGLLANSPAVVIGAMVVAPWITPLRATAFGILRGRLALVAQGLATLLVGALITIVLSVLLGRLVGLPDFGSEVLARTSPNLLDLGIALVAGGIATYAKIRSEAVSSLAGTAIAVALVPPVCVVGLLLSAGQWTAALGAALLYLTNLLGILSGGILVLATAGPAFRQQLRRSRLGAISLTLTALLVIPLTGSFIDLLRRGRQQVAQAQIEQTIQQMLERETITLGQSAHLARLTIDWEQNPPLIRAVVRVSDPELPTYGQVAAVQQLINSRQPIRFRLVVERSAIDVVGPETPPNPEEPLLRQRREGLRPRLRPEEEGSTGTEPEPASARPAPMPD